MKTSSVMKTFTALIASLVAGLVANTLAAELTYPIVGTGQQQCYDNFHASRCDGRRKGLPRRWPR